MHQATSVDINIGLDRVKISTFESAVIPNQSLHNLDSSSHTGGDGLEGDRVGNAAVAACQQIPLVLVRREFGAGGRCGFGTRAIP